MNSTRIFKTTALALAALLSASAHATVYSASPNVAIPDNNATGVSDTITVADAGTVGNLSVSVGMNHTWIGDLIVRLTHGSTTVTLMDRPGRAPGTTNVGDSSNLSAAAPLLFSLTASAVTEDIGVGCDSAGTVGIAPGCLNTSFVPEQSLAAYFGGSMAGAWTLQVSDNESIDTGGLASWSLNITPEANDVPEPGSLALVGLSLAGLLAARRRQR